MFGYKIPLRSAKVILVNDAPVPSRSPWERRDVGNTLGGRYTLIQLIGEGGQAQVYQAVDMQGGPDVAIKILRGHFASDASFRERFSREANALRGLKSPAALRVFDEFFLPDQRPALVTELLHGRSLGQQLTLLGEQGQRIPLPGILAIMGPVAQALDEAHSIGVIHRDLKPDNLFLLNEEQEGVRVKLLDFGFAKFLHLSALTAQGTIAGSPRYIAPEAWLGVRDLTAAFDVYSLGAVIYHCLVGHPPFPEQSIPDLLVQVTRAPRPKITDLRPDLPEAMNAWVERSLAIRAPERFQSVGSQFQALQKALA